MAEASGGRTHQRRDCPPLAGFEDRDDHRTACASVPLTKQTPRKSRSFTSASKLIREDPCQSVANSTLCRCQLLRLLRDSEVRLDRLEPGEFLLRLFVRNRRREDHIIARLPVHRRRYLVLRRELH